MASNYLGDNFEDVQLGIRNGPFRKSNLRLQPGAQGHVVSLQPDGIGQVLETVNKSALNVF